MKASQSYQPWTSKGLISRLSTKISAPQPVQELIETMVIPSILDECGGHNLENQIRKLKSLALWLEKVGVEEDPSNSFPCESSDYVQVSEKLREPHKTFHPNRFVSEEDIVWEPSRKLIDPLVERAMRAKGVFYLYDVIDDKIDSLLCQERCDAGHECSESHDPEWNCPPCRTELINWRLPCGHRVTVKCSYRNRSGMCSNCP